jgi:superfamily II DNA/RNA helicase
MADNSTSSSDADDAVTPSGILEEAREAARKDRGYDWVATRSTIEDKFQEIFDGRRPYGWQMDITEALLLGRDCIAIAGTGSGKTLPFGMPLLSPGAHDKMVLVLSPLNELEAEQVRSFVYHYFF